MYANDLPMEDRIGAEMRLFAATETLVSVLKQRGATRTQAWEYARALPAGPGVETIRRAQFDLVWPEEKW